MGKNSKLISAICYLSLFFAPFLLPLVVYFIVDEEEVKRHAAASFISHLIPAIVAPVFAIGLVFFNASLPWLIASIIVGVILVIGTIIWNIVRGIQLLRES
ncbi:hypothetical protein [Sutcliffiella halmapala]|uniref:hypothetical protein n=1 Tax=Sutcliffiella halmapala TaxID=79882 RepID=UPI0009958EF3|nr:hypothetical protein [Sutcliffiella halmapala]